jgi:cytochrome b subunit of formate dehydrogenase
VTQTATTGRHIHRFTPLQRRLHLALMTSFLGLAATGLPLLFSAAPWAGWLSRLFGGFEMAGLLHRVFATIMLATFATHVGHLAHRLVVRKDWSILWGPTSLVPQPHDVREFVGHVTWFLGRGPRPRFDHFTYWEKFDYWAVFWGMAIIGGSGFLLWFPLFFSRFLPGEVFNLALLVHGEEALLAVGFIFTIHFFNGHFRPEKFPMDTVIFTGSLPEHELRDERPGEYERLLREGTLDRLVVEPPTAATQRYGTIVGSIGLGVGVFLFILIVRAALL